MNVFVVWKVDHMDGLIVSSLLADNAVELRRTSQDLNKASATLKAWAIGNGGSAILEMTTMGAFQVPAEKMTELPEVRRRFEFLTDRTLSVGVGMDLPEAYKAMEFASSGGGNKIALYTEEMESARAEEVAKSLEKNQKVGTQQPVGASQEQPEESQSAPPESQQPPAEASAGSAPAPSGAPPQDAQQAQGGEEASQDPRTAIVQALQEVKANADAIEALKESNPQAYEAVKDVVQAMILMAQGMMQDQGGGDVQKSERPDLNKEAPPGFNEGTMLALKEKHGETKAFQIAWAAHNKHKKKKEAEDLEKEGPMPQKTPSKTHMTYPDAPAAIGSTAGTVNDGKIKVTPVDPGTGEPQPSGWNGGRAGLIMSPKGSAVSSRQPGSD